LKCFLEFNIIAIFILYCYRSCCSIYMYTKRWLPSNHGLAGRPVSITLSHILSF